MKISPGEISFMVFRRVTSDVAGEFSLNGRMLRTLMELDGKKNVAAVAKSTGLSMGAIRASINKLLSLNLIETVEEAVSSLDDDFFDYLKKQLAMAIGPIADVIIEDSVNYLGHSMPQVPNYRAAELVDLVSRDIHREEKRNSFKKNMLKKIRDKGY